jgi:hypothetical protein
MTPAKGNSVLYARNSPDAALMPLIGCRRLWASAIFQAGVGPPAEEGWPGIPQRIVLLDGVGANTSQRGSRPA